MNVLGGCDAISRPKRNSGSTPAKSTGTSTPSRPRRSCGGVIFCSVRRIPTKARDPARDFDTVPARPHKRDGPTWKISISERRVLNALAPASGFRSESPRFYEPFGIFMRPFNIAIASSSGCAQAFEKIRQQSVAVFVIRRDQTGEALCSTIVVLTDAALRHERRLHGRRQTESMPHFPSRS